VYPQGRGRRKMGASLLGGYAEVMGPLVGVLQDVTRLPMLGYMEQTMSQLVTKAIAATGLARPKYPHLDAKASALVHLALYLKAHNPR
jgi:hypothetical protein